MEKKLKLPIGIENFEKLRARGFYFCIFFCEDGGVKLWMH